MSQPNVSPELFFETANGYQKSAALKAAIELDIFTLLGEGSTAKDVAKRCEASERGVRILCDFLVINGFLEKQGNIYRPTLDSSVFLSKKSPAYVGSAVQFLLAPELTSAFDNLAEAIRKGTTTTPQDGLVVSDNPMWVTFAQSMAPLTAGAADYLTQLAALSQNNRIRVLDIAAGHGMFGITFARRFPSAEIYAVDWKNVLELAQENAEKAGVADRFHKIPGSAFEVDFGSDYDVALITNFLHHFDPQTCVKFLKRVFSALRPEGKAITLEFVPNEDRVTPKLAAAFSMIMLAETPAGDAYTFRELEEMHLDAGFSRCTLHEVPQSIQSAIVAEK
jgi:2-polyprenyl-3-methyl-5-hydroxy-6-metoxy-1,4-benzoquinol methylase